MNQAVVISQRPENDPRGLNFSLLNSPFDRAGTSVIEVPWAHTFENLGYSPRRNVRNLGKKPVCVSSTNSDKIYAPAPEEFTLGLELGVQTEEGALVAAQGRHIGQSLEQVHGLSMPGVIPDMQYPSPEAYLESQEPTFGGGQGQGQGQALAGSGSVGMEESVERPEVKQHRERNRVAARKCRQKAKKNVADLQRRERDLGRRNRMLLGCVSSLREEILVLKNEILRHSDCNSNVIQNYIANAARRQLG
ncbi:hypothetical protein GGR50DRAFT_695057 [Xylaria sp. CBS 124048]|nr:hypothetical protein GGR50DRAFT_695057 [Xylaria sp. CBS 124048]